MNDIQIPIFKERFLLFSICKDPFAELLITLLAYVFMLLPNHNKSIILELYHIEKK